MLHFTVRVGCFPNSFPFIFSPLKIFISDRHASPHHQGMVHNLTSPSSPPEVSHPSIPWNHKISKRTGFIYVSEHLSRFGFAFLQEKKKWELRTGRSGRKRHFGEGSYVERKRSWGNCNYSHSIAWPAPCLLSFCVRSRACLNSSFLTWLLTCLPSSVFVSLHVTCKLVPFLAWCLAFLPFLTSLHAHL